MLRCRERRSRRRFRTGARVQHNGRPPYREISTRWHTWLLFPDGRRGERMGIWWYGERPTYTS